MKSRGWFLCLIVPLFLSGCDFPFSTVDRPEFDNPIDPGASVPIEVVLELIRDENPDPDPLVNAILDTGARFNTDVWELFFDVAIDPINDLTGVIYLPRLEQFTAFDSTGTSTLNLAPFLGHRRLDRLAIHGFDAPTVESIPPLVSLRTLDLSGTVAVVFGAMQEQTLTEFIADDSGITTLEGIDRLGALERLRIGGGGNTYPESDIATYLPLLADSLEVAIIREVPTGGAGFIDLLPELVGVGFNVGTLSTALLTEIAGYQRIEFFGAYGVMTLAALTPLAGSGISDLEIHGSPPFPAVDLTPLATTDLTRINLSFISPVTGISSLPSTVEIVEFIATDFTDAGAELDDIASSLPELRVLDISFSEGVTSLEPISANAATMANLEQIFARQDPFGASPIAPWGVEDANPGNGVADLIVLPRLNFLDLRNSIAAHQFTNFGADVGFVELLQFFGDDLQIDSFSEDPP